MISFTATSWSWKLLVSLLVLTSSQFGLASNVTCRTGAMGAYYSQSGCVYCQKIVYSATGVGGPYASCSQVCTEGTSPVGNGLSVSTYCCQSDLCNGAVHLFGQLGLIVLLPSLVVLPVLAAIICPRDFHNFLH